MQHTVHSEREVLNIQAIIIHITDTNPAIAGAVVKFTGQPSIKAMSTLSIRGYITFIALSKCCNKISLRKDKSVITGIHNQKDSGLTVPGSAPLFISFSMR